MLKTKFLPVLLFFVFTVASCSNTYFARSVQYSNYSVHSQNTDEYLKRLIKPYADSLNKSMNEVIAVAATPFESKRHESGLGNLVADILKFTAEKKYNTPVDAAIINYGGIRLHELQAGSITRGKVYEIYPFDNTVVVMKLTGMQLQSILDSTARHSGWPVSGIKMQIKNDKAVNVKINDILLQPLSVYTIATVDYLANGGENLGLLRTIPRNNNGYLLRDGIFSYLSGMHLAGNTVSSKIENRVTNAE